MNTQLKKKIEPWKGRYQVTKIFQTIQGEGPFAGTPATFIRLAGCNLQCVWCDTDYPTHYAYDITTILSKVEHKLVVITGGEPFRQNIGPLVKALCQHDYEVQIETNGTLTLPNFPWDHVTIVCSPKTDVHPDFIQHCTNWKFVYSAEQHSFFLNQKGKRRRTGLNGTTTQMSMIVLNPLNNIFIMPLTDDNELINIKVATQLCLKQDWRLCVRLQNILGLE